MMDHFYDLIKYVKIAASVADMGVWIYDIETKKAYGDENMCHIFGIDIHEPDDAEIWFSAIHPDDIDTVRTKFNNSIINNEIATYNFKIIDQKTNELKYIQTSTFIIFDKNIPKNIVGINLDYTKFIKTEENIKFYVNKLEHIITSIIDTISIMAELRDPYTTGHENRVAHLCVAISNELNLTKDQISCIDLSARVHDIGKFWVPSEILTKPGILLPIQFELVKLHSKIGYNILRNIEFPWPVALIVLQHHERLDGSGYPLGLTSNDILFESKIIAVADVMESVMSHRPYRAALGIDVAVDIIQKGSGVIFDSKICEICIDLFKNKNYIMPEIRHDYAKYEI